MNNSNTDNSTSKASVLRRTIASALSVSHESKEGVYLTLAYSTDRW